MQSKREHFLLNHPSTSLHPRDLQHMKLLSYEAEDKSNLNQCPIYKDMTQYLFYMFLNIKEAISQDQTCQMQKNMYIFQNPVKNTFNFKCFCK